MLTNEMCGILYLEIMATFDHQIFAYDEISKIFSVLIEKIQITFHNTVY